MRTTFIILLLFIMNLTSSYASLAQGPGGSGGGTDIGIEFQAALDKALENYSQIDNAIYLDLSKRVQNFKVIVVDEELVVEAGSKNQICVAINDPLTRTITINRAAWKNIKSSNAKEGLALHEFLSLEKLESTGDYHISGQYFAAFDLNPYSVNKVETISEKAVAAAKLMYTLNIQDSKNALFKSVEPVCKSDDNDDVECTIDVTVTELGTVYKTPGALSYTATFFNDLLINIEQTCPYCR